MRLENGMATDPDMRLGRRPGNEARESESRNEGGKGERRADERDCTPCKGTHNSSCKGTYTCKGTYAVPQAVILTMQQVL